MDDFSEVGSKIIVYYVNNKTRALFDQWKKESQDQIEYGQPNAEIPIEAGDSLEEIPSFGRMHDQQPLRRALFKSDIRFLILPVEYMFGPWGQSYAYFEVKIIHGSDKNRLHWLKKSINDESGPRVYLG